jgi:SWI/SNF-related matrix-associated actin-dependent regulator of chromatin subfamily D
VKRNLRVFISNTAHDQTWQNELADSKPQEEGAADQEKKNGEMDVNTGKGIPGWVMRIEGRLLDVSYVHQHANRNSLSE